jgi:hypothetical protein
VAGDASVEDDIWGGGGLFSDMLTAGTVAQAWLMIDVYLVKAFNHLKHGISDIAGSHVESREWTRQ